MTSHDLAEIMRRSGQGAWATPKKSAGLLALLNHIASAQKKSRRPVPCSAVLARMYSSPLRDTPAGVPHEPLGALVKAGLIEIASPAKTIGDDLKSACYLIAPAHQRTRFGSTDDQTPPGIRKKLENAPKRRESGLNHRWKFREQLLHNLALVSIPDSASATVDELLADKNTRQATRDVVHAIATREHRVTVKPSGQIVTSLISCPRVLKPLLHIASEPVVLCDIASAHWMFLPRLVSDRLAYCRSLGYDESSLDPMNTELIRLIAHCSTGSFYANTLPDGATDDEIKRRKKLLNVLLNSPTSKAAKNIVWRELGRKFPLCIGIVDAIKRKDHRAISRQLQHFQANAIRAALIDMQTKGLPAIPDTDALIVRRRDHAAACLAIGKAMFAETRGVRVTVGGVHYSAPAPEVITDPAPPAPRTVCPTCWSRHGRSLWADSCRCTGHVAPSLIARPTE